VIGRVEGDRVVGVVSVTVGGETVGPPPTPVTSVFGQPASVVSSAGRDGIIVTLAGTPRVTVAGIDDDVWAFLGMASPELVDRTRAIDDEVPLGTLPAGYSVITNGPESIAGSISIELGYAGLDPANEEGRYVHSVVGTTPCVGLGRSLTAVNIDGHRGWLTEGYVDVWGGDATSDWVCWQLAANTYVFVTGDDVEDLLERARAPTFIPSDEWFDRYADQLDTPLPPPPP
jgi:hypothetical protein